MNGRLEKVLIEIEEPGREIGSKTISSVLYESKML